MYKYKNLETNQEEEIQPERWVWGAIYNDGTELHQFGNDETFHRIGEINQEKLTMFVMYKFGDMTKRIDIPWRNGMKVIHKYRNISLEAGTPEERKLKIYVFGYKFVDTYHFSYILPDDRIVQSPVDDVALSKFGI